MLKYKTSQYGIEMWDLKYKDIQIKLKILNTYHVYTIDMADMTEKTPMRKLTTTHVFRCFF